MGADISVRFWGVRGSIACPGMQTARYGGNTACVEVRCGGHLLIFDAGTGLRALGNALLETSSTVDADIFFSHYHMDHICGLPFFAPCHVASSRLRLWGGLLPTTRIKGMTQSIMTEPFFPAGPNSFSARIDFRDFHAGDSLQPHAGVTLRTGPLVHPGGSIGYRLEHGDRSIVYITDTEHRPGKVDPNVLRLAAGADVMIYDAQYTDEEFATHIGWGHSTWQEGVRLADAAAAKLLVIFHHDPKHDDNFLDGVIREASALRPQTLVATEGRTLHI